MQLLIANKANNAGKAVYVATACLLHSVSSELCNLDIQLSHLLFQNFLPSLVLQHVLLMADNAHNVGKADEARLTRLVT